MERTLVISGFFISFLAGVFVADLSLDPWSISIGAVIFLFPFMAKIPWKISGIWFAAFFFGVLRLFFALHIPGEGESAKYALPSGSKELMTIAGIVSRYPDVREDKMKIFMKTSGLKRTEDPDFIRVSGEILVNVPKNPLLKYGDELEITGTLTVPPEWEDFSYKTYLEKEGVYAYIPWGKVRFVSAGNGSPLFRALYAVRTALDTRLRIQIPEPEASFAAGILLGGEKGFPPEIIEEFRKTGLSHLLALSGFNITILIVFLFWMFRIFPKKWNLTLTFLTVIAFVLLTGASSSIVRAAIMGILSLFILHSGNEGTPFYFLLWSMFFMVLMNPFLLARDVSFQLSVAAVSGLILFTPLWSRLFDGIPRAFGFREALEATLAAQAGALPLIAFYFGTVSIVSPLANLLVAPVIPVAMLLSSLSLLPGIGMIFAFGAYGLLRSTLFIVHSFSTLPFSDTVFSVDAVGLCILYGMICLFGLTFHRLRRFRLQGEMGKP